MIFGATSAFQKASSSAATARIAPPARLGASGVRSRGKPAQRRRGYPGQEAKGGLVHRSGWEGWECGLTVVVDDGEFGGPGGRIEHGVGHPQLRSVDEQHVLRRCSPWPLALHTLHRASGTDACRTTVGGCNRCQDPPDVEVAAGDREPVAGHGGAFLERAHRVPLIPTCPTCCRR